MSMWQKLYITHHHICFYMKFQCDSLNHLHMSFDQNFPTLLIIVFIHLQLMNIPKYDLTLNSHSKAIRVGIHQHMTLHDHCIFIWLHQSLTQ